MTDQWHDDSAIKAQVVNDDDDAPDDWETALDEKPKASSGETKPKTTSTTKNKPNKKPTDNEKSEKIVKQPDGDYTPEELDNIKQKEAIKEEQDKLNMVSELVDKNGELRSLDDMDLYTREEFLNYSLRLYNRLDIVSSSEFYPEFIEHFLDGLTKSMPVDDVKRLAATLQVITIRKQSEERERKSKSKPKRQAKPQLRTGRQSDYGAFGAEGANDFDEDYDDEDFP